MRAPQVRESVYITNFDGVIEVANFLMQILAFRYDIIFAKRF
jgi:hypothetical protein